MKLVMDNTLNKLDKLTSPNPDDSGIIVLITNE